MVPAGLILPQKAAGPAADDNDRLLLPVRLHVNAYPVPGVALYINFAAAHSVARRITHAAVDDDGAAVHGISHSVLRVAVNGNAPTAQIGAEGISGNPVDLHAPSAHARSR